MLRYSSGLEKREDAGGGDNSTVGQWCRLGASGRASLSSRDDGGGGPGLSGSPPPGVREDGVERLQTVLLGNLLGSPRKVSRDGASTLTSLDS